FWRASRELAAPGETVDRVIVAPGTRFAWIDSERGAGAAHTRVVDLERRRVGRVVSEGWWCQPIVGPGETRMASAEDEQISLHDAAGAVLPGGRIELQADVRGAAAIRSGSRGAARCAGAAWRPSAAPALLRGRVRGRGA